MANSFLSTEFVRKRYCIHRSFSSLYTRLRNDEFNSIPLDHYLYATTRNLVVDKHRRRKIRKHSRIETHDGHVTYNEPSSEDSVDRDLSIRETRTIVEEAVSSLSTNNSVVVRLLLEGGGGKEIAKQLGISHDCVRQR